MLSEDAAASALAPSPPPPPPPAAPRASSRSSATNCCSNTTWNTSKAEVAVSLPSKVSTSYILSLLDPAARGLAHRGHGRTGSSTNSLGERFRRSAMAEVRRLKKPKNSEKSTMPSSDLSTIEKSFLMNSAFVCRSTC